MKNDTDSGFELANFGLYADIDLILFPYTFRAYVYSFKDDIRYKVSTINIMF